MLAFIVRRLLWMVLLLLVISFLTYLIFYTLPSADPALLRAGRQPTPELIASIRETLGLDQPWYVQYFKYLERLVFHFDFGYSYQNNVSVREQIFDRLPATATLAIGAMVVWLLVGIPVGIVSAIRRGRLSDRATMGLALVLISAPVYWLGLVALYLFSNDIGRIPLLPGQGAYPTEGTIFSDPATVIPAMILPWFVLAASFAAIYARFLRGNLLEVMSEDYIRTARAKGLHEQQSGLQARRPLGDHADHHDPRPRPRHPARRRDPHRDGLQHPRHRPPRLRRDPEERHADRPGDGASSAPSSSSCSTSSWTSSTPSSTRA